MSKPGSVRASVRDHEERTLEVDDSVASLGFGFLHLPPTRRSPLVIKTVKKDSWADLQGVVPGTELLELDGEEAGCLTPEHFREALQRRPLRLKLAPPYGEVWKQVAHFQQQVVALSLQKVHLQQALKDESDRVMRELGICTELEKSNSLQHKAKLLKDQAQQLQEKRDLEEEVERLQVELETSHAELASERQQLEEERNRWQAELEESHRRLASEQQSMEDERKDLEAKLDTATASWSSQKERMEEEKSEMQASISELQAELQRCKAELAATAQSEEFRQGSQAELEAEKLRCSAEREESEAPSALGARCSCTRGERRALQSAWLWLKSRAPTPSTRLHAAQLRSAFGRTGHTGTLQS
ncbi:unnamed protein product [Durusdinium trenchii]|uniref:PDZ domain-containing protein n=1 Tax=Durusdinium trenchii TaxID=1381693 RepID=A0ABP0QQ70_9DINO